jgi:hypothetical protein
MNAHQISRIPLNREVLDCIVFWTKNPEPLMPFLDEIDRMGHPYYFQFTLTPYNSKIGREKVVWRYDPIFITPKMTVEFHLEAFSRMIDVIGEHIVKAI